VTPLLDDARALGARAVKRLVFAAVVASVAVLALPALAAAADFNVSTTADGDDKECTDDCTLREAVTLAGNNDQINVPKGVYTLQRQFGGELFLVSDHIVGAGARDVIVDGARETRLMRVVDGTSSVAGVTLRNGNGNVDVDGAVSPGFGGAVFVASGGALTLTNSTVSGNAVTGTAAGGGGIAAAGNLSVIGSTISGNTASAGRQTTGGGILAAGTLLIGNTTISGNSALDTGGGTASRGGGVAASAAFLSQNSTIAGNTASSAGGVYMTTPTATGATQSFFNTIVGSNTGGSCGGTGLTTDSTHNNIGFDTTCQFTGTADRNSTNPLLGTLTNNGGATDTLALAPNSPAINQGSGCASTDQRGVARPQPAGGVCDIGAYEYRAPTLTVVMAVTTDDGGTRAPGDFTVHVRQGASDIKGSPAPGLGAGRTYTLNPGTYVASADAISGYTRAISGDCDGKGAITLAEGDARTCTITANDIAPTLNVITLVTNDEGGTRAASDFVAHVRVKGSDVDGSPQAGSAAGTVYTLDAGGPYVVDADAMPGYTEGITGTCAANGSITLVEGQAATCTIVENDIGPRLRVITQVVNDNGGTLAPGNFTARVTGTATNFSAPGTPNGTLYTLVAGRQYTISATPLTGYAATITGSCATNGTITLALAADLSCTITLNDIAPKLTVVNTVVNNSGGSAASNQFSVHVTSRGAEVTGSPQAGSTTGTPYTLAAGSYSVFADGVDGYASTIAGDCAASGAITLAVGDVKTCQITNDDGAAALAVMTEVVNDSGGTADAAAFTAHVRSGGVEVDGSPQPGAFSGTSYVLNAGTYTVSLDPRPGYAFQTSGDCDGAGNVALNIGESKTCTVTANDVAPTLKVVTTVVNDSGGSRTPSGFSIHVRKGGADVGNSPKPGSATGTTYTLAAGTYSVGSDAVTGYTTAVGGACAASGSVTLQPGDAKTCTVTGNDNTVVRGQGQLPAPVPGKNVNALPSSGTVKKKLPGSSTFVPLDEGEQIPLGTIVDVRTGRVTIVAAAGDGQTADFYGGIFKLGQTKGAKPITVLTLVEKLSCPKKKASAAAKKKKKRRLWGDGKGRFRTRGKHSAATVVGTKWLVEDRCTSTLTRVARGKVRVRDFVKKKTVLVKTGKKYVARARR
jgi:CSLREA domain-containing protein